MTIPTSSPAGVELLASEEGVWLIVNEGVPWWAFWRRGRAALHLDRLGMIWLYQAMAKYLRRGVVEEGFDELAADLQSSLAASEANIANRVAMNDDLLEKLAHTMRQKGWVKM